jgi:hypothetical protein
MSILVKIGKIMKPISKKGRKIDFLGLGSRSSENPL